MFKCSQFRVGAKALYYKQTCRIASYSLLGVGVGISLVLRPKSSKEAILEIYSHELLGA